MLDQPEFRKAIGGKEFFFENNDGRIVLIFPFYDKIIVGTSDIPIENPDQARCTEDEIDYFIKLVNRVFPNIEVDYKNIVFQFSGVRPLEYSKAKTTGQISRDHTIQEDNAGITRVYSLVGGKWTSYRAFAEQVTDKVLSFLGRGRIKDTKSLPVGGGKDYPSNEKAQKGYIAKIATESGIDEIRLNKLFERYGTRTREIAQYIRKGKDAPLIANQDWTRREVEFLVEYEKVVHLSDLLLRRSTLAWLGAVNRPLLHELADIIGNCLGWDDRQKNTEEQQTLELLKDRHGVKL